MTGRIRLIFQRIGLGILWAYALIKDGLDWFGRAALFEDPSHQLNIAQKGLNWLFSTPGWAPTLLAVAATALLFWPNIRDFVAAAPRDGLKSSDDSIQNLMREPSTRISLHDFLHGEAAKVGWGASGSNESINLLTRLRQAAADGDIHFWGKKPPIYPDALAQAPLIQIASTYWHDHGIEPLEAFFQDDNSQTYSRSDSDSKNESERYYDLHLTRKEALNWLQTDGRP